MWLTRGPAPLFSRHPKGGQRGPAPNVCRVHFHATVRSHLEECVTIFWDAPPIPVGDPNQDITPLIIGRFLTLLYDLCQKHLLASVQPIEVNLLGRIRGRPLAQQTMRRNLAKGRADRVYCRYQVQSIDTKANQILLAALRQGLKYLDQHDLRKNGLARLAAFSADALNGVTLRRIKPSDFQGLHYGGFMGPYRQPLRWAHLPAAARVRSTRAS